MSDLSARRFGGVARLYGDAGQQPLRAAHVVVVGIGGVGSWAVEALVRSGVGRLTLVDMDHVAESNINRQVLALQSTLGAAKIDAMAARCRDIAPDCRIDLVDDFITPDNVADLMPACDFLVDAIDQARAKAALIAWARRQRLPLVVCGGAGGRIDPLRLRRDDLALTRGDALLSGVRARLRRDAGFPREAGKKFKVPALFSDEPLRGQQVCEADAATGSGGAALGCAGYGSMVTVTAAMGLAAAQAAIAHLVRPPKVARQPPPA